MSSRARLRAKHKDLTSFKLDTCQLYKLKFIPEILFAKSSQSGFIVGTYSEADSTIETSLQINFKTLTTQTEVCQAIVDKLGAFFSGSRS
jgi:c-di-GMP-related signal transduction protein